MAKNTIMAKKLLSALLAELNPTTPAPVENTQERKTREVLPGVSEKELVDYVTLALQAKVQAKKENVEFTLPKPPAGINASKNEQTGGLKAWAYDTGRSHVGQTVILATIRRQFFAGQVTSQVIRECRQNMVTGEMTVKEILDGEK